MVATAKRPVRGIILQGGFMSALRVLCPKRQKTARLDQFVNIDKIALVTCPTLVVHGRKDGLFNVVHAESLHKKCPGAAKIQPLFIPEGMHVDFEDYLTYWRRLHTFLHTEVVSTSKFNLSFLKITRFCSRLPSPEPPRCVVLITHWN